MVAIDLCSDSPSWTITYALACLLVYVLNDLNSFFFRKSWKERYSMHLYALLLCGIMATGDILIFGVSLCQILSNLTTSAYRFLHFSTVSSWSCWMVSNFLAET